jgi:D-alanyl-D-alanine carboxypeptidase (penicillin-binding protein 5/6)
MHSSSVFTSAFILILAGLGQVALAAPIPKAPAIASRSFLLVDFDSGRVLAEDHADERMEPASITKLMTAYVVFEAIKDKRLKLDDQVTISEHAWKAEGSRTFVQVGTQVPVDVLIKGMIVQSGNDATIALAERVGGSEPAFAQMMNEYSRRLGMRGSNWENAAGLPGKEHFTTARDTWNKIKQPNRNGLLGRDPSVDGIKTGHTETAGYCLVTSAKRDTMRLISVVMGTNSVKAREDASAALLNYGFTFFETTKVKSKGATLLMPRVFKSEEEIAAVGVTEDIFVTVGRGESATLKASAKLNEPLIAPIAANTTVGELTITSADGDIVARAPLRPLAAVAEGGLWTRMIDGAMLWFE